MDSDDDQRDERLDSGDPSIQTLNPALSVHGLALVKVSGLCSLIKARPITTFVGRSKTSKSCRTA